MPPRPPRPAAAKRRSVCRLSKKPRDSLNATYALYQQPVEIAASPVTDEERAYFLEWVTKRNLSKQYFVLALTYWMRVRSKIWANMLVKEHRKELYMIVCIHIALKWLGYDEVLSCNFVQDLREVAAVTMDVHQEIEFLVLSELGWLL
ncbi:EsV-1-79 [Ectocarpus siliculosus]|uniref:EsV-1-79 n=1 Tax=Ectocarpus siliculosus TaxID=2880 RepID=D8LPB1_ECTSI|nr:EsV-1-79 [Ectocarpus siliculosus]|eukprot:CBN80382.1 EsV-1-79 [Ectocarpus siliculosus]